MKNKFIHYYNPNTKLSSLLSLLSFKDKAKNIEQYFQKYSGKQYVLITFSGRSALYLAYKALGHNGEVITSPLTCLTAIYPIVHAGNRPVFIDINPKTLTMETDNLSKAKSSYTIAVQAIHFGGIPCEMEKIVQFARDNNLHVIEDCAQGFGAEIRGKKVGSFGDVSIFSLSKNLYGISGGVIATDNEKIFKKAREIQNSFTNSSITFIGYRFLRNFLKSSNEVLGNRFYFYLMNFKQKVRKIDEDESNIQALVNYLKRPSKLAVNFSSHQIASLDKLHKIRKEKAKILLNILKTIKEINFPETHENMKSSFVKLYLYSPNFDKKFISWMNDNGIEIKHLEEEYNVFYQKRIDGHHMFMDNASLYKCPNYLKMHDHLASIPLHEEMDAHDFYFIRDKIKEYIRDQDAFNRNSLI
jgi:dTDP-4-amino-4,6-dideoxygalactose transaminase